MIFLLIFISRGFERNGKSKNVLEFDVEKERVLILKKKNSLKKLSLSCYNQVLLSFPIF